MSDLEPSIAKRIQEGVDLHVESSRQAEVEERRLHELETQRQAEEHESKVAMGGQLAQAMRQDAYETAKMLADHGIVPATEVKEPYYRDFMFKSLGRFALGPIKTVKNLPAFEPVWIILTKREFEGYCWGYGDDESYSSRQVNHYGVGLNSQGELLEYTLNYNGGLRYSKDSDGRNTESQAYLIGRKPLSDERLIPQEKIVLGASLDDQPTLNIWRRQLEILGVAMITGQPYKPFEIGKK